MRNLSENSSTSWFVFGMFLIYFPIGVIQSSADAKEGEVFSFITDLNFVDWIWVIAFGLASVLNMTTRAIAI